MMRFVRLEVSMFRAVRSAALELGPGLNVLYGPNDLGKSTLALALRAALVTAGTSTAAEDFVPWSEPEAEPEVTVTFLEDESSAEPTWWRVRRRFTSTTVVLERSTDGDTFTPYAKGKGVDDELRTLLALGIAAGQRTSARSFLLDALLSGQRDTGAVLDSSLEDDDDDSGQRRVARVLSALGRDARVSELLARCEKEVGKHFTAAGRRKQGKGSELARAQSELQRLEVELEERRRTLDELERLTQSLETLRAGRMHALARQRTADEALRAAELSRRGASEGAEQALRHAMESLAAHDALSERLSTSRQKLEDTRRVLSKARDDDAAAVAALESARARWAELDARRRAAKAGNARELERAELQEALAGQRLARADLQARLESAESAQTLLETRKRLEAELVTARAHHNEKTNEVALAAGIIAYGQWRLARDARARLGESSALTSLEAELRSAKRDLDELVDELTGARASVPDERALKKLRELRAQLDQAEAALGGGLTVVIKPRSEFRLSTSVDDGPASDARVVNEQQLDAERRISLEVGNVAQVEVSAGAADVRADVDHLKRRWKAEALPVLEKLGARSLGEMDSRLTEVAELEQRHAAALQRVATLESKRERVKEAPSEVEVEARRARIGSLPLNVLEQAFERIGNAWEIDTATQHEESARAAAAAYAQVIRLEEQLATVSARLAQSPAPGKSADLPVLRQAARELDGELTKTQARLDALAPTTPLDEKGLAHAQAEVDRAAAASVATGKRRTDADTQVSTLEGVVTTLEEQLGSAKRQPLVAAVEREKNRNLAMPSADLAKLTAALERSRDDVDATTRALADAEAKLEQLGGIAAHDAFEEATFAHRRALAHTQRLTVEADAWKLLAEALTTAEAEVSADLGASLAAPVSAAFSELTRGRYEKVAFDRLLGATALTTGGSERAGAIEALSVGTQDHLATLIRLALATQLRLPVVLDDHLVHSDPSRMSWFRDALAEAALKTQVLVITCRPLDYVSASQLPKAGKAVALAGKGETRVIDLALAVTAGRS